jgi:hypothetical protein
VIGPNVADGYTTNSGQQYPLGHSNFRPVALLGVSNVLMH